MLHKAFATTALVLAILMANQTAHAVTIYNDTNELVSFRVLRSDTLEELGTDRVKAHSVIKWNNRPNIHEINLELWSSFNLLSSVVHGVPNPSSCSFHITGFDTLTSRPKVTGLECPK